MKDELNFALNIQVDRFKKHRIAGGASSSWPTCIPTVGIPERRLCQQIALGVADRAAAAIVSLCERNPTVNTPAATVCPLHM